MLHQQSGNGIGAAFQYTQLLIDLHNMTEASGLQQNQIFHREPHIL
jgi:hypothetical protein